MNATRRLLPVSLFLFGFLSCGILGADVPRNDFTFHELVRWGRGEDNRFRALPPSGFEMQVTAGKGNAESKAVQTACTSRDMTVVGQDRLVFSVTGTPKNGQSSLTVLLLFREESGLVTRSAPPIQLLNTRPKQYSLALGTEFGAPDLPSTIAQIKFQLDSGNEPAGHVSTVKITDVRIVSAGDAGSVSGEIVVNPSPRPLSPPEAERPAVKVFFDFDNDDKQLKINTRWSTFIAEEKHPGPGFRDRLLRGTAGVFSEASSPEDADVIVYARTTPSPNAGKIAEATAKGKGLVAYGDIHDAAIAALLPADLQDVPFTELPPRARLHPTAGGALLYAGGVPAGADYAWFRKVRAKTGSRIFSTMGEYPAAVSSLNGKILYSTVGIGVMQLASRQLYDLFFLRAVLAAAGKPELFPVLDALERRLELLEELRGRRDVFEVLDKETLRIQTDKFIQTLCALPPDASLAARVAEIERLAALPPDALVAQDGNSYTAGAHRNNFGRFGWTLDEGLLGANLNRQLGVANNLQEYSVGFTSEDKSQIDLPVWCREPLSGNPESRDAATPLAAKNGNWNFKWRGPGTVRYAVEAVIPESWKGEPVFFEVEAGIDDTDITSINGHRIGGIDAETPGYWQEPRSYRLPPEAVKWGERNRIVCDMTNLSGDAGFNSRPRLRLQTKKHMRSVTVTSLDWVHKRYELVDAQNRKLAQTISLVLPYILYETSEPDVVLSVENLAAYAAFSTLDGLKTVKLDSSGELYRVDRDGPLTEGWVLFWNGDTCRPFAIYFPKYPDAIRVVAENGAASRIEINRKNGLGAFIAGWPYGASNIDTGAWNKTLPKQLPESLRRAQQWLFNFPVGCLESYAVSEKEGKVHIRNRFRLRHLENEFGIPASRYAVFPPLVGYALKQGMAETTNKVEDFGIATDAGPISGVSGDGTLHYTLRIPPFQGFAPVDIAGYPGEKSLMTDIFNKGIRWSSGGYVPEKAWTPQSPQGEGFLSKNFCLCSWGFNLIYCFQSLPFMSPPEKSRFLSRAGFRFFEPLERYGFKLAFRYREEPFSYVNYPVMLPPFYRNKTEYAENYGSTVIFGDENEPGYILPAIIRLAADYQGQRGAAIANWNAIRDMSGFALASEDWACLTSGCRESWQGAFIDMLNCEYPMMCELARLAAINGDRKLEREAIYRAARKTIPTLMRFSFQDFMRRNNLNDAEKNIRYITGWRETSGAAYETADSTSGTIDVFDVAGGVSEDLLVLYKLYVNEAVRDGMARSVIPSFRNRVTYDYMAILSMFGMPRKELDAMYERFKADIPPGLINDHPGMSVFYRIGMMQFARHPELFIDSGENLWISEARFNPKTKTGYFRFCSGSDSGGKLWVYAAFVPEAIIVNGRALPIPESASNGILEFPATPKILNLEIRLGANPNRYRHPMLKNLME